jgi:hypothetical protein
MTIQITKTETKDIEVPVPSFWKSNTVSKQEYTAILDKSTAISLVLISDDYTIIQHCTPEDLRHKIESAFKSFDLCTETEFMEAYNKTLKSLSLQPELV